MRRSIVIPASMQGMYDPDTRTEACMKGVNIHCIEKKPDHQSGGNTYSEFIYSKAQYLPVKRVDWRMGFIKTLKKCWSSCFEIIQDKSKVVSFMSFGHCFAYIVNFRAFFTKL